MTCLAMSRPMLHRLARQPPDGVPPPQQPGLAGSPRTFKHPLISVAKNQILILQIDKLLSFVGVTQRFLTALELRE